MLTPHAAAAFLAVLFALWWARAYYRERDAGDATGHVAETVLGIGVGAFAAFMAIASASGSALSAIGDQLGAAAPYLAHLLTVAWGYFALEFVPSISARAWAVIALAILVGVVMFVRDD